MTDSMALTEGGLQQRGVIEVVRQFTPNWFTVTMGTGILALALNQFPLSVSGLHEIATGLWLSQHRAVRADQRPLCRRAGSSSSMGRGASSAIP